MSERGYFSQRNLIPGSAFLLILLAYNYAWIFNLLNQQNSALFGVVVPLLGSPTLGFLISQLWWCYFQSEVKLYDWEPIKVLIWKYNLSRKTENSVKRKILMIYDYVLHSEVHTEKNLSGLSSYAFRRYDNYVLLSTVKLGLILGTGVGILTRVASEHYIHGFQLADMATQLSNFLEGSEFIFLASLTIAIVIVVLAVNKGQEWLKSEYEEMHKIIISTSIISENDLWKVFPPDCFNN